MADIHHELREAGRHRQRLLHVENLLGVEIGEWLGFAAIADQLSPFLGENTKRICGYVPGLAAQRRILNGQS